MAAIMNLKYQSVVIELLIKEFDAVSSEIFNVLFYLKMVNYRIIIMSPFIINSNPCVKESNPLSPKSDQHQISPCNINAL